MTFSVNMKSQVLNIFVYRTRSTPFEDKNSSYNVWPLIYEGSSSNELKKSFLKSLYRYTFSTGINRKNTIMKIILTFKT